MKIIRMMKQADKVLAAVKKLVTGTFWLYPYQNGREHGWALVANTSTGDGHRQVCFSEDRRSDNIVVYTGDLACFYPAGNVPNDSAYENAQYFPCGAYEDAARAIVAYFHKAAAEEE